MDLVKPPRHDPTQQESEHEECAGFWANRKQRGPVHTYTRSWANTQSGEHSTFVQII